MADCIEQKRTESAMENDCTSLSKTGSPNEEMSARSIETAPVIAAVKKEETSKEAEKEVTDSEEDDEATAAAATTTTTTTTTIVRPTPPTEKPEWATGDPFFDTMAGMASPEYRRYYGEGSYQDQILATVATCSEISSNHNPGNDDLTTPSTTEAMIVPSTPMTESSSSTLSKPSYSNTGLEHWNKTREQWTKGRWHIVPSANSDNPALSAINPKNHDAIYDSLVYDRKRLSKPIPLPLVIKVLVSGWKRDGLWSENPVQHPGPGSGSASAPTATAGLNAYIPGFSSTNSPSVLKKA
ncbi:hypothetical protein BX616_001238 [Lobosporangium transversale]|uniref:Gag1-like clamp domain-containing protein n=1 Tax=Lobosporangium transversale TaxID=64571 RepID=A0A1Y2GLK7_9FUNG|nr:hypothetical protein BCR41DRAFT_422680 [Lobosporangium transversale]KAF9904632.1 hypothetical protein BX616_001238 [Lobosporangium transversale]ORZ14459.1 hypothetical protein BCR41DRAFT_422680 [Lobosporangium transversale]|eukprot:XP_021880937.1 hypothetical protein BCR41DRAFT_422680 [Lobosporangium transversale]